jgi:hypothetical protein
MFRITTVQVTAVPDSGENRVPLEDWLRERFWIEVALPRKTLSIPVLDNMSLSHSAVLTSNARLRVAKFNPPNMTATITNCFVLFHRISVSAPY